jgi:hypothetical protein
LKFTGRKALSDFDPDKVKRWHENDCGIVYEVVSASDYDTLLKLYRELDAANANLKFEEVTDSAVNDELAREIKQLKEKG